MGISVGEGSNQTTVGGFQAMAKFKIGSCYFLCCMSDISLWSSNIPSGRIYSLELERDSYKDVSCHCHEQLYKNPLRVRVGVHWGLQFSRDVN